MGTSRATAKWNGAIKTGDGMMKPAHASEVPFSMGSRFEGKAASNPEEMIGAAFAGCFSMALSLALEKAGAAPKQIRTAADVKLDKDGEGFTITAIELATEVDATGIDAAKLQQLAEKTEESCPVGKALASVARRTVTAKLTTSASPTVNAR